MSQSFDVIIVGGGLVGASLALALEPSGLSVAIVEVLPPKPLPGDDSWDTRVYAISPGTAAFLESCGVWQVVPQQRVMPVEAMRIYGDDAASRLDFSAYDAGLRELAFIVENRLLQHAAWQCLQHSRHASLFCPAHCAEVDWSEDRVRLLLEDRTELTARLIVGADGADSWLRAQAGIKTRPREYGQLGVVANFTTEKPHRGAACQWFRRDGVLAICASRLCRVSFCS